MDDADDENFTKTSVAVCKGSLLVSLVTSSWPISGSRLFIDEILIDSIAQACERNEIVHTSFTINGQTYSVDLSGVSKNDIYAALLCRNVVHLYKRHFLSILEFRLATFIILCVGLENFPLELVTAPVYFFRDSLRVVLESFFAQQCELEADREGMKLLHSASYNPFAMLWLLEYYA